jgi:hypothetical protein
MEPKMIVDKSNFFELDKDFIYEREVGMLSGQLATIGNKITVIDGNLLGLSFKFMNWSINHTENGMNLRNDYEILTMPNIEIPKEELERNITFLVFSYVISQENKK